MQRTVSFFEAIQMCFKKCFDFSGRSSRSELWWWLLLTNLLYMILVILFGETGVIISYACFIVLFIPSLALMIRRLHDVDRSGWFILLGLIPCVGPLIMLMYSVSESDPKENKYGPIPNTKDEENQY